MPLRRRSKRKMDVNHRRFCDEYIQHGNGSRAYKTVYPAANDNTARTNSSLLLTKTHIRRYLTRARLRMELDTKVTRERIVGALAQMAFVDMRKLGKWNRKKGFVIKNSDDLDDASAYAVESIRSVTTVERGKRKTETEVKVSSKQGALEKLLKMHGWDTKMDSDLTNEERIAAMKALMGEMDTRTSTGAKKKK